MTDMTELKQSISSQDKDKPTDLSTAWHQLCEKCTLYHSVAEFLNLIGKKVLIIIFFFFITANLTVV